MEAISANRPITGVTLSWRPFFLAHDAYRYRSLAKNGQAGVLDRFVRLASDCSPASLFPATGFRTAGVRQRHGIDNDVADWDDYIAYRDCDRISGREDNPAS